MKIFQFFFSSSSIQIQNNQNSIDILKIPSHAFSSSRKFFFHDPRHYRSVEIFENFHVCRCKFSRVCGAHAQLCQRENQSKLERHRGTSGMRIRTRARAIACSAPRRGEQRSSSSSSSSRIARAIEFRFCVLAPAWPDFS